jgi:hypothetical protein
MKGLYGFISLLFFLQEKHLKVALLEAPKYIF